MDNASIHHVQNVVQTLEGLGVLVYFLPPYSPDLNPIQGRSSLFDQYGHGRTNIYCTFHFPF